jgi:putative hydrolase of the HAD superfamily
MGKKTAIRATTFDAAGTLMGIAEPVGETYARFAHDFGVSLSPRALDLGFREVFPSMPPMAFPGLNDTARVRAERAWWHELVARVVRQAGDVPRFDEYFDALFAHYASGAAWRAYPEAHEALRSARGHGLRVAVVSNFDSRLPPILRDLGFESLLDTVVTSTGCGAAKPDVRIFHHALKTLGATANTALHVGDSVDADYHGASAAGMRALHLHRGDSPAAGNIPTIKHLGELESYLDQHQ